MPISQKKRDERYDQQNYEELYFCFLAFLRVFWLRYQTASLTLRQNMWLSPLANLNSSTCGRVGGLRPFSMCCLK
jgi:hypothetical protein